MNHHPRLEWRCRRGTKELDLLLQTWLRQGFDNSSASEQEAFLALLEWPDDRLIHLLLGSAAADQPGINALVGKILALPLPCP